MRFVVTMVAVAALWVGGAASGAMAGLQPDPGPISGGVYHNGDPDGPGPNNPAGNPTDPRDDPGPPEGPWPGGEPPVKPLGPDDLPGWGLPDPPDNPTDPREFGGGIAFVSLGEVYEQPDEQDC